MKSLEELKAIRDRMKEQVELRDQGSSNIRVVVGMATCGIASGARPVLNALASEVQKRGLTNVLKIKSQPSTGMLPGSVSRTQPPTA